jgi:DNA-binding response OmpR family regulator
LELACSIRQREEYRTLPIALLEDGLSIVKSASNGACSEFIQRIRSLWAISPEEKGTPRRLLIDQRARQIDLGKQYIACSPLEFRMLLLFIQYPRIVFSRDELVR